MKAVLFYDPQFPGAPDIPGGMEMGRLGAEWIVADGDTLAEELAKGEADCFVHLHGPYFPKAAWPQVLAFAERGGGVLSVGGAPFRIPVARRGGEWAAGGEMTAYHQQLHIHEALPIGADRVAALRANPELPLLKGKESLFSIMPTYGLILHVTHERDQLNQATGSSGPMSAHIRPLLTGTTADGRDIAAPVVLIEHTKGKFAGGRWLFVNQPLTEQFCKGDGFGALKEWATFCALGVTELWLKPGYAAYRAGERAQVTLQTQVIRKLGAMDWGERHGWSFDISVRRQEDDRPVWHSSLRLEVGSEMDAETIPVEADLEPGTYSIVCEAVSDRGERRTLRQGFWGYDFELLRRGTKLAAGRDYFRKDGKPFPVVGMTYMTSDVGRKFVFLPNVARWDDDMRAMKEAGINLLRTGLWTGWRHLMFEDGHASEEVLRAIDAFILTAAKHGLEVTFNFFAFAPEAWEGVDPYLDPRSVQAQKRFIAAVVSRHKHTANVQWDLINEPSLFDPKRIFSGPRTLGDPYERAAYADWLAQRHGSAETLQDKWNMTNAELPDFAAARLPEQTDISFHIEDIKKLKKSVAWLDYTLFTMEMHNRWARELTQTIRALHPGSLVTVGQDEALGMGPRPSPFFYADSVDYTTVHTWWLNDQLVWDSVFGKDPGKPTLIQETGIMYVETPDNRAKRSEAELRNLLERKYAYAFATGGAGAVQWLWNTNYFMDNVNESNIGALRADGTQRPEADVSYDFGAFIGRISHLFEGRELEEVAVVFPYSNDFSSRRFAFDATAGLTRVMTYRLKMPLRGLSEYHLDSLEQYRPRLILVPSPHNFSGEALDRLLAHIERHGGTLLFTGPLSLDEYWRPAARAERWAGRTRLANVSREEELLIGNVRHSVSFGAKRIGELNKEVPAEAGVGPTELRTYAYGAGTVVWCPLPVELNENMETLAQLYRHALDIAGVRPPFEWRKGGELPGIYGSKLRFREGNLYVFVSEYGADAELEIRDPDTGTVYSFGLESERSLLFATGKDGEVLAVYRGVPVRAVPGGAAQ